MMSQFLKKQNKIIYNNNVIKITNHKLFKREKIKNKKEFSLVNYKNKK